VQRKIVESLSSEKQQAAREAIINCQERKLSVLSKKRISWRSLRLRQKLDSSVSLVYPNREEPSVYEHRLSSGYRIKSGMTVCIRHSGGSRNPE
jgi:hypothetical protein